MSDKNMDVELRTSLLGCEGAVIVEVTPADAVALFEQISSEIKRLRAENSILTAERDPAIRELRTVETECSILRTLRQFRTDAVAKASEIQTAATKAEARDE